MKAYLITTGVVFGLITLAHIWRLFAERHLAADPWFVVLTVSLGVALAEALVALVTIATDHKATNEVFMLAPGSDKAFKPGPRFVLHLGAEFMRGFVKTRAAMVGHTGFGVAGV